MKKLVLLLFACLAWSCQEAASDLHIRGAVTPTDDAKTLEPYVVSLYQQGQFFCSGVLVAPQKILSAAHCFVREKKVGDLSARIGERSYPVQSFHTLADRDGKVSEDYFPNFDLALIEIKGSVAAANFPRLMEAGALAATVGEEAWLAGFGVTATNQMDLGTLRFGKATIKRVNRAGRFSGTLIVNTKDRSGPCMGDSGGPLFVKKDQTWFLAGIVHGVNWYTNPNFFGEDPCLFDEATYVIPSQYLDPATLTEQPPADQAASSWVELCEAGTLDREELSSFKLITLRHRFKTCRETYAALTSKPLAVDFGSSLVTSTRSLALLPRLAEFKGDLSALTPAGPALPPTDRMKVTVRSQDQLDFLLKTPGLSQLELLQSSNQSLNYTHLTNLTALIELRLNALHIKALPDLSPLTSLRHLEISQNELKDLNFLGGVDNLEYLNASSNQIEQIRGLAQSHQLKTLVLSNNRIQDLSPLQDLSRLEKIYAVNNRLQSPVCPRPEIEEGDVCAL